MMYLCRLALLLCLLGCGGTAGSNPVEGAHTAPSGPAIYTLSVEHRDEMSETFRLIGLRLFLNDAVLVERAVSHNEPIIETPVCLFRDLVSAGTHSLRLELNYRGHGLGIFLYLRDYRFEVISDHAVTVSPGNAGVHVVSTGAENGGVTTPLEERPMVRWEESGRREDISAGCSPGREPVTIQ